MKETVQIKGVTGIFIVHADSVEISRRTAGGFISQGGSSGVKKFFFKDITAIEYKTPTIWANGYIKVLAAGSTDIKATVGLLSSTRKSAKDPNTIILRAFGETKSNEADRVYNIAMERWTMSKESPDDVNQNSRLDELQKLGELKSSGVLSESEFASEKRRILTNKGN